MSEINPTINVSVSDPGSEEAVINVSVSDPAKETPDIKVSVSDPGTEAPTLRVDVYMGNGGGGSGGGAVDSVNGQTGAVVLGAEDVGADPAGTAADEAKKAVDALPAVAKTGSWNDLTDKPFYDAPGETITFDGNLEGREIVDQRDETGVGDVYIKVSEAFYSAETLNEAKCTVSVWGVLTLDGTISAAEVSADGVLTTEGRFASENGMVEDYVAVLSFSGSYGPFTRGTYLRNDWFYDIEEEPPISNYCSRLEVPVYAVPIDEKYLPRGLGDVFYVSSVNVEQDGDAMTIETDRDVGEVMAAHEAGKSVMMKLDPDGTGQNLILPLVINQNGAPVFLIYEGTAAVAVFMTGGKTAVGQWSYNPEALPNPAALIFTGAVEARYDGNEQVTVDIPAAPATLPNPNKLTFTGAVSAEYDGSKAVTVEVPEGGETIPDYVRTEAETVARIVNQHQSGDSIVFPFLTDAHCGYYTDKTNAAVTLAGQLLDLIGRRVPYDFIANGGDMANGAWDTTREMTYEQYEDYTALTAEAHKGVPAVWVPGNHDDAPYMATADRATQTDMVALIGRKSRISGAECPAGCSYGYLDLESRHLRVICLDTDDKRSWGTVQVGSSGTAPAYLNAHNVGGAQLQWLAETALDFGGKANPAEWSVVVVSHVALNVSGTFTDPVSGSTYQHNTANAAAILNAYRTGVSGSITHNGVTAAYDYSAQESRAAVICCVHGHNHRFGSEELAGGLVSIGCPNVMNGRERESDDGNTYAKGEGAEGTSFCILTIDRENQMIYADCAGAGYDREFEYTTIAVAYTNQLPISTDASGAVYNGKGWKENTYLSSGNDGTKTGIYASGFIPVEWNSYGNAVYHCKNVGMQTGQDSHRVCTYDADKAILTTVKTTVTSGWFTYGADGNIEMITVLGAQQGTAAFIRICCGYLGDDSIITLNEEIT